MEVSRSSFLISILISALLIQHFAVVVVECGPEKPKTKQPEPVVPAGGKTWCVPKPGTDAKMLQANIDFACGKVDCKPIQAGGPCFEANNAFAHASYAMNSFYRSTGGKDCGFAGTGVATNVDPSKGACKYQ